jgi:hypothetical protein
VQVPRCSWQSKALDEAPYKLSGSVAKLASITFWSIGFFLDTIKPWFLTERKFATVLIIPSSWGSQLGGYPARISKLAIQSHSNRRYAKETREIR